MHLRNSSLAPQRRLLLFLSIPRLLILDTITRELCRDLKHATTQPYLLHRFPQLFPLFPISLISSSPMSSSLVHLGIAASAGLVLGAAGAFSFSSSSSTRSNPLPPPPPSSHGNPGRPEHSLPPLTGQGKPAEVYHGGLTGRDLRSTILNGTTIGQSPLPPTLKLQSS